MLLRMCVFDHLHMLVVLVRYKVVTMGIFSRKYGTETQVTMEYSYDLTRRFNAGHIV